MRHRRVAVAIIILYVSCISVYQNNKYLVPSSNCLLDDADRYGIALAPALYLLIAWQAFRLWQSDIFGI